MSIIQEIFGGLNSVANLIDSLHTSEEEKASAKFKLAELNAKLSSQVLEHETKGLEARARIIEAEAKSDGFLTRSWRPICALFLMFLVGADSFGWLANPLSGEAWILLQIMLGGYVVTRGGEKIVKEYKKKE